MAGCRDSAPVEPRPKLLVLLAQGADPLSQRLNGVPRPGDAAPLPVGDILLLLRVPLLAAD